MSDPLNEIIQELSVSIERTQKHSSAANYQLVQMKLSELSGALREMHQAMTQKEMKIVIAKLGNNEPLTSDEIDLIREWIVGDAESYITCERNFNAWLSLFTRLARELKDLYASDISPQKVLELSGLTQIAMRLIPNILYYSSEKERVAAFDRAVSDGIDSEEAKAYRNILQAKLDSTDM
ncbi:MAG: hypothetical protein AB1782_20155 [Cyanobacteriota bacterium]